MKNKKAKLIKLTAFSKLFLLFILVWQPSVSASDYFVPVSVMNDNIADDGVLNSCLMSAISSSGNCILPEGTLVLSIYPPALRQSIPNGIVNLGGATLSGQGSGTVIKGMGGQGFDVLQLNGVSNFNIKDLSITAISNPVIDGYGVNGISMTNGTNNIRIKNVHVYDLPYLPKLNPAYVDGGKAFTVQTGQYNTSISMKNIYVEWSSSRNVWVGFQLDADTNINAEPDNINVIGNTFEAYFAGIVFGFVQPNQPMNYFGAAILDNAIRGGKYGIALARGRAYYLRGNYVVLKDDLYLGLEAGDFVNTRQALSIFDITYATIELNTFQMVEGGDYFLRGVGLDELRILFRHNNFYGQPSNRTHLINSTPSFPSYFNAAGTFY